MKKLVQLLPAIMLISCVSQRYVSGDEYRNIPNGVTQAVIELVDVQEIAHNNGMIVEITPTGDIIATKEIDAQIVISIRFHRVNDCMHVSCTWKLNAEAAAMMSSGFGIENQLITAIKGKGGRNDVAFAYMVSVIKELNPKYL